MSRAGSKLSRGGQSRFRKKAYILENPSTLMAQEDPYKEARRRVKAKKKFYRHLTMYIIFSVFFFLLNAATSEFLWFIFPVLGWGVGVAAHYVTVFGMPGSGRGSDEWEAREIERELRRMRGAAPAAPQPEPEEEHLDLPELEREPEPQQEKRRFNEDDLV